jgi:hypothetical protein
VKTKRIEVTLEITIPDEWSIGETEDWLAHSLYRTARPPHSNLIWSPKVEVGMQRSTKTIAKPTEPIQRRKHGQNSVCTAPRSPSHGKVGRGIREAKGK